MKKLLTLTSLSALVLLLCSGCASFVTAVTGFKAKIQLNSNPSGATATVTGNNGLVIVTNTPAIVKLRRGDGYFQGADYKVRFEMPGYVPAEAEIHSQVNPWIGGNILVGGVIGALIVDPLTGGMWWIRPHTVDVNLVPMTTSLPPEQKAAPAPPANAPPNSESTSPPKETPK